MDKRLTAAVVTGTLALGGLGAGLVALPVVASASASAATAEAGAGAGAEAEAGEDSTVVAAVGDRLDRVREALDGLVADGTLDEEQADAVAETLDEALPQRGPGGPGEHGAPGGPAGGRGGPALEEAAGLLGLTAGELRAELQEGVSLAAVAEEQGVAVDTLVDGLVAAAEEHVAEHLAAGDITQEQADQRLAGIEERIAVLVEREDLPLRGGPGGWGGRLDRDDDAPEGRPDGTDGTEVPAPTDDTTAGSTGLTA